jgi:hypothetical protein
MGVVAGNASCRNLVSQPDAPSASEIRMRKWILTFAVAAFEASALCAADQGDEKLCLLAGHALNSATGQPMAKIVVTLYPTGGGKNQPVSAITDSQGQFALRA